MHEIELTIGHGSISGYVIDAAEPNIKNYLMQHTNLGKSIAGRLAQRNEVVALLRNLYVDLEHRGQGIGSELVSSFLQEAEQAGATSYILLSDSGEEQVNDLDLNAWYENFGFCKVLSTGSGPLMVMPDSVADDLTDFLGPQDDECYFEP
ncbi:GNAT family N-acetyltransferase [Pseudomonas amygdali]|nr:GNAT family N-acetyltransferase [Pseudomonas amygdali]